MRTGRHGGRTKVARRHGGGTQMGHALQCLVQCGNNAGVFEHIQRSAGALDGLFTVEHIGPARRHQYQVIKTHGLHGPGRSPYIASVAGVDQNKTCLHEREN